jgi:hypothetical protein
MTTSDNVIQFSDLIQKKLGGVLIAKLDSGTDEQGNTVVTADLGPLEVSLYTSQDDGAMIVQIDSPTLEGSEQPTLRVYLNDTTLYDQITESSDDSTQEGA